MNSECAEHQKNIPALLLGDLSAREKDTLENHLAACSICRSERERFAKTIQQLGSVANEPVPRHFFVYPEEKGSNPWKLFRLMPPGWQAALACASVLALAVALAAISRMQIQSHPGGWAVSFGRNDVDLAAFRKDLFDTVEKRNREVRSAWIREIRDEFSRSYDSLNRQQQIQLRNALARLDSRITGRITNSEGQVREDTQKLVSDLYRVIAQDRARDLEAINLRFDSTDASNAIKARQTNEIIGTLLQVADLQLK